MPGIFADPEVWVLVAAVVFVAVLWKRARQSLVGGLDARTTRIRAELDTAANLREEAERTLAEYQAKRQEATAEAEAIIAHARAEAERVAAQAARDLEDSLERRRRLAEDRIAQEEARALDQIRATAVEVAVAAARRVVTAGIDEKRGAALIDTAIDELPRQLQ